MVITRLNFILCWLVLRYIFWYGFLCVLAFELYSLVSCILYLRCHSSSNLLFWSQNLLLRMLKLKSEKIRLLFYYQLKLCEGRVSFEYIIEKCNQWTKDSDYQQLFLRKGASEEEYPESSYLKLIHRNCLELLLRQPRKKVLFMLPAFSSNHWLSPGRPFQIPKIMISVL